jgi:hypothetical protein
MTAANIIVVTEKTGVIYCHNTFDSPLVYALRATILGSLLQGALLPDLRQRTVFCDRSLS